MGNGRMHPLLILDNGTVEFLEVGWHQWNPGMSCRAAARRISAHRWDTLAGRDSTYIFTTG
jgi:hypothetical protein